MSKNAKLNDYCTVSQEASAGAYDRDNTPFVHRIKTTKGHYVYDVNTMKILRVAPVVWAIITDMGAMSEDDIVRKYSGEYNDAEISHALVEIRCHQKERGLLLAHRPQITAEAIAPVEEIERELASKRQSLTLVVTNRCNFRCAYCVYNGYHSHRHHLSGEDMSWDTAKAAIDDYLQHRKAGEVNVGFYGGEPLLHLPLIKQCVAYVWKNVSKDDDVRFTITTNGYLLSGEAAEFLGHEPFHLVISLDGPRETHDRYRVSAQGQPTWDRVVKNMAAFAERYGWGRDGRRVSIHAVVAPPNDVCALQKFFDEMHVPGMGVPLCILNDVKPCDTAPPLRGDIVGYESLYEGYLEDLKQGRLTETTYDEQKYQVQRELFERRLLHFHKRYIYCRLRCRSRVFPGTYAPISTCLPGARKTCVMVNGDYYPCERVSETDYLKIGSAHTGVDCKKVRQLLREWIEANEDECRYCWCLSTCQVGCWENVPEYSYSKGDKRGACARHRANMENLVHDYCAVLEENPHAFDYARNIRYS